jgi:hypothetical protein
VQAAARGIVKQIRAKKRGGINESAAEVGGAVLKSTSTPQRRMLGEEVMADLVTLRFNVHTLAALVDGLPRPNPRVRLHLGEQSQPPAPRPAATAEEAAGETQLPSAEVVAAAQAAGLVAGAEALRVFLAIDTYEAPLAVGPLALFTPDVLPNASALYSYCCSHVLEKKPPATADDVVPAASQAAGGGDAAGGAAAGADAGVPAAEQETPQVGETAARPPAEAAGVPVLLDVIAALAPPAQSTPTIPPSTRRGDGQPRKRVAAAAAGGEPPARRARVTPSGSRARRVPEKIDAVELIPELASSLEAKCQKEEQKKRQADAAGVIHGRQRARQPGARAAAAITPAGGGTKRAGRASGSKLS